MEGQPTIALISTTSIQQDIYEHIMCCNLLLIVDFKVDQVAAHLLPTSSRTLRRIIFNHIQIKCDILSPTFLNTLPIYNNYMLIMQCKQLVLQFITSLLKKIGKKILQFTCQLGSASPTNSKFDIAFRYIHDLLNQSSVIG